MIMQWDSANPATAEELQSMDVESFMEWLEDAGGRISFDVDKAWHTYAPIAIEGSTRQRHWGWGPEAIPYVLVRGEVGLGPPAVGDESTSFILGGEVER